MKTPITVRIEADLLEQVRQHARSENRTLTNFIETLLRRGIEPESMKRSKGASGLKATREPSNAR